MSYYQSAARALAHAFAAGPIEADRLVERGERLLGKRYRWLRALARRVETQFGRGARPRAAWVLNLLMADAYFLTHAEAYDIGPVSQTSDAPEMAPLDAARQWRVAPLATSAELAAWLGLTITELEWFADRRCFERKHCQGRLRHYHYRPLTKRFGSTRLIEAPKPRLKALQRQILEGILDRAPPHESAHGFRRGRSIATFAASHVGKRVVLKLDLEDFFPSVAAARVSALYRSLGYPEAVADLLTGLSTNATPDDVWEGRSQDRLSEFARRRYRQPHLPQGAPTSPALANLCVYRLDCRLAGLADASGGVYTRYADDLAFSGDAQFARSARRFPTHVAATVLEEGFWVNHHKTRVMPDSQRQQLAGLVVNRRPSISRRQRDQLKATLTNCVRLGPASQNRDGSTDFYAHLNGRVAYVEMLCSDHGAKLRGLFDQIEWPESLPRH